MKILLVSLMAQMAGWTAIAQISPVADPDDDSSLLKKPALDGSDVIHLKASFDDVFDWANPFSLSAEKMDKAMPREDFKESPFYSFSEDRKRIHLGRKPFSNIEVEMSFLDGIAKIEDATVHLLNNSANRIFIQLTPGSAGSAVVTSLKSKLHSDPVSRFHPDANKPVCTFHTWTGNGFKVIYADTAFDEDSIRVVGPDDANVSHFYRVPARSLSHLPASVAARMVDETREKLVILCDLDFLFQAPSVWSFSAETFDTRFDMSASGFDKPACFEWLSTTKDRLRFTRKPFNNVDVDLQLFGGRMRVEEATLDFKNGRLSLANFSLYNRGDSGSIPEAEFDRLYKLCGQQVGQTLKIAPRQQPSAPGKTVKVTSWLWTSPVANALMEYSDFGIKGREIIEPEFLRLKLGAPGPMDWNFNQAASGLLTKRIMKADLPKNVAKNADGDVYIKGVPMVDQGDKGYCVAASCQRLFEYYQLPADQHEFAKLFGTTANGGTSAREMEEALDKVDNRFKTRFKPLYNMEMKRSRDRRSIMDAKKMLALIKEHATEGVPLLWTLTVGLVPEDPPLAAPTPTPGQGFGRMQTTGGHMRMIIGYNEPRGQIVFTDSWGEGHEIKRMAITDAASVTDGVYLLEPRW